MKVIHSKVSAKWTSVEGKIAVTSFFFLRYVCPSLVTPSNIGKYINYILFFLLNL